MLNYFRRFVAIFLDPRVSSTKKMIFLTILGLYWIFPDLIPFLPLDDLLVTLLGTWVFMRSARSDTENTAHNHKEDQQRGQVIDVEGQVVEEDGPAQGKE